MKILIIVARDPYHSFLVKLHTEALKRQVKDLIARRKNSLAMAMALSKGRLERAVACHEIQGVRADCLITEKSVSWDLTARRDL